jgi:hypothetical protein
MFLVTACNLPGAATPTPLVIEQNIAFTQVAQTIVAQLTISASTPTAELEDPTSDGEDVSGGEQMEPTSTDTIPPTTEVAITDTPSPTATEVGGGMPVISASIPTNCRFGPDPYWQVVGYLLVGDESIVHAKSPNSFWWYIENPDVPGDFCWVWSETTIVEGDVNSIPVRQPPATPTPTPSNTPTPTSTFTPSATEDAYP